MEVAVLYLRAEVVACRQEAEEVAASYHQEVGVAEEAACRRVYHILVEVEAEKYRFR